VPRKNPVLKGFDYKTTNKPCQYTLAEWQDILAKVLKAGGRRRAEFGETFLHGPDGILQYEIYATIRLKEVNGEQSED
jgi:hypothetical protein